MGHVRHFIQCLPLCALLDMRVIGADGCALMANDIHRNGIAHAGILQQACRCVPQAMETKVAQSALSIPAFTCGLVAARIG